MSSLPIFGLAPMEGVSELPFRLWMSQTSAPAFACTPFLRTTDTFPRQLPPDFAPELDRYRDCVTYQLIPQLMAARAEDFIRTARFLLESASFVDLNAGCPSPHPISGGAGSALLREVEHFRSFMHEIGDGLAPQRFSLKMRTGFHDTQLFPLYLEAIAELPLARLTVHGRTRTDRYDGQARWDLIAAAAQRLAFPVVASGDIVSAAAWQARAPLASGIEQVIVGRGALRNPWIFAELRGEPALPFTSKLLSLALATLGLLIEGFHQNPTALDAAILSGCFRGCCGFDEAAWSELYDRLCLTLRGQRLTYEQLEFNRATMGRLKMLWNSLRSSLPPAFFEPTLLRASSFAVWTDAWQRLSPAEFPLDLYHREEMDWLYTSSRVRPNADAAPTC